MLALLPAMSACALTPPPGASATLARPGLPVSATPIRFVIPAGLATGASAENIDVVTDQTGMPWDVAPAHMQLTLQNYALQTTYHVPQLFVYPAQQYAAMNPNAAESLTRLQAVLTRPSASYDKDTLPRVPFLNAGQFLTARQTVVHFAGGSGVRFITQPYIQDVAPINNDELFYQFSGLSDDGKYYIVAVLPVNLPFLAPDKTLTSPLPAGGVPFPAPSNSPDAYHEYFTQIVNRINAAPPDEFSPSLQALDALVRSLSIDH